MKIYFRYKYSHVQKILETQKYKLMRCKLIGYGRHQWINKGF